MTLFFWLVQDICFIFSVCVRISEGIGEGLEKEDCVQALSGQIFMGMVSSQFQARLDTVRLIENLVGACIRFVYFSREDELRSKVRPGFFFLNHNEMNYECIYLGSVWNYYGM